MAHKEIPVEALINLRHRLDGLPSRCQERRILIEQTATLYGVSTDTLYRALRNLSRPKSINRSDSGTPRKLSLSEMELYCEIIAAMKIRTSNKKGRHLSTARAIELLEDFGMDTPNGFIQPSKGTLTRSTVNYYLKAWGYDNERMTRQPPAVRFQAEYSNECWHFDLSQSDLKHVKPQRRKVGSDARVSIEGVAYEVEPDLAGETVVLWWGLFDNELYVEFSDRRYGPFYPVDGPIPLHRYRKHKKTKTEERADRIADLAKKLGLPRTALDKNADLQFLVDKYKELEPTVTPFNDPDPFQEFTYPSIIFAKLAISDYLAQPLAKLSPEQMAFINALLTETLNKKVIIDRVRQYFHSNKGGEQNAY